MISNDVLICKMSGTDLSPIGARSTMDRGKVASLSAAGSVVEAPAVINRCMTGAPLGPVFAAMTRAGSCNNMHERPWT